MGPDRQNFIELHRSHDETTGDPIDEGLVPTTDGAGGFTYERGGGDATDIETVGGGSGLPGDTVQEDLDYLANLIVVGTPGSLTAGGSPVAITNDSSYNAFPGIARLSADKVLLVYRKGSDHASTNDGRIVGKIGTLAADRISVASWGSEFEIYNHASLDVRCDDPVAVIDGDVWVSGRLYDGSDNQAPFVLKCDDGAESLTSTSTWTKHDITMAQGSDANFTNGFLVKTDAGTYLQPVCWSTGANLFVGAAIVSDPTDWSAPSFETIGSGANDYSEISIHKLPDGTLVGHIRADGPDDHFRVESTDNGNTWSSPSMLFDATGFPAFRRLPSGLYLTVYRSNAGSQDAAWRQSEDDTTYSSETILDSTGSQMEYASILALTRTKSIVVYGVQNSGSDSDIRSQIFTDSSTFGLSVSGTPSGPAGGDLSGTYPNPSVVDDSHSHTAATLPAPSGSGSGDHEHMIDVFNGDASTTVFEISDEPLDPEQVFAFVGGSWTAITVSGAMNTTITFGSAPGSGTGNVVIQYPAVAA